MPTSTTGSKGLHGKRGFTLLELMVTLAIMVLMSGVVMVAIEPALEDARLRAATSLVIAQLQYARSYAITNHTDAAVFFDPERHGLSVQARAQTDDSANTDSANTWNVVTTQAGRFRTLPEGVNIADISHFDETEQSVSANEVDVSFSALGQAEDMRVILRDARGNQRIITVDGVTGRCEIVSNAS